MLEALLDSAEWLAFLLSKEENEFTPSWQLQELRAFIENEEYVTMAKKVVAGEALPLPVMRTINKRSTGKKRVVFTFPRDVNWIMKLLAWELRAYDSVFPDCLYSFRKGRTAGQAMNKLIHTPGIRKMYSYKTDIHDYFNSVDIPALLPQLKELFKYDEPLYHFFKGLLTCPFVLHDGKTVTAKKGIMAGTPLSPFLANLFLIDVDRYFESLNVPYFRYSDDIIVFAPDEEILLVYENTLHRMLHEKGLTINPDKDVHTVPHEAWTFLGYCYRDGKIDVAPASVYKLKAKMRRKSRALMRWARRKNLDSTKAAKAFIRRMNKKMYSVDDEKDLCWARWYFPVITTTTSLHAIDMYMQDCIRYIVCGHHGKKRFNLRYTTMKEWGYRPLLHEYYTFIKKE